jgi:hypothetical protein
MAISTKKKNIIIAMWKTGEFKSFTAIAKHYKISTKTAQKIINETPQENESIVEIGVQYEMAKKSTKNPHEINTIEKVVQERVKASNLIYDLTNLNLEKLESHLRENKKSEKINVGDGVHQFEMVELGTSDYKNAQETIDKASITMGVNQRHANSQINVNTQTNVQQNNLTLDDFYEDT